MPKNDFTGKKKAFISLHKLPKNVGDLGKIIVARGFEKLPIVLNSTNLVTLNVSYERESEEKKGKKKILRKRERERERERERS